MPFHPRKRRLGLCALVLALIGAGAAQATLVEPQNIVHLIDLSQDIVAGRVVGLQDGYDAAGVPYTEVRIEVDEALRGAPSPTLTFRQFGLLQPRERADGRVDLNVSPDGWPRFEVGETVLLFLYRPGSRTGLRTCVGLTQGKFTLRGESLVNVLENRGLLQGVEWDAEVAASFETRRFQAERTGARALVDFVRRAVQEQWVEQGRLRHAQP